MNRNTDDNSKVKGTFVTRDGERYYAIANVDKMPPFFISLVSDSDHWMFVASNGGLTAGRVSPDTALFPYVTVDKIYDSTPHTGCKTIIAVTSNGSQRYWEPFSEAHNGLYPIQRNLYKNLLGNRLVFEEINHELELAFRYRWVTSDNYGFVRQAELENLAGDQRRVVFVDGLQNLLPAGTPRLAQTNTSYLVDAYKWTELDGHTGLAMYTLFSGISDRAEPCESLRANTVFCLGLERHKILLSAKQLDRFRDGQKLEQEDHTRGVRGAYFVNASLDMAPQSKHDWQLVANIEQSQGDVVALMHELDKRQALETAISESVERGSDALARIMAAADGFQKTAEEHVWAHHYANVLFNVLRGGTVDNQYKISARDFAAHVRLFNSKVYGRHQKLLDSLPQQLDYRELLGTIREQRDPQLHRVSLEYLPITFGRRHGDPSRPWNQFSIRLTDEQGNPLLTYEGNWRDIFQNWEALLVSYPEFIEAVIAKFVNASTADGYNPYRITNEGIDWEVEDPDDPWSYIGYWGDHQIIYLQKLLELSDKFHPARLQELLHVPVFSYANVPYRIKPFEDVLADAKNTVVYDNGLADRIDARVADVGADGRLILDGDGHVYQISLLEKLLVPLLAKLGNLVVDGGIWLNTQRPEWNDANNALVGQGLSMVTLCYLRRYVKFLQRSLAGQPATVELSAEVNEWLTATATVLGEARSELGDAPIDARRRYRMLTALGQAASHFRTTLYREETFSGTVSQNLASITEMLDDALAAIDHSIRTNKRDDGLYHAYNLLGLQPEAVTIDTLYPMLEGQVAALSSGAIAPAEAVALLEALFASEIFRPDQNSFMLYPDRKLPRFLEKNCIPAADVEAVPLLVHMLDRGDRRIIERDTTGTFRFNADLVNVGDLNERLDALASDYGQQLQASRQALQALYEKVFDHKSFTGRSGGMFGFEGLGSIYWHMVGKLLLAVGENFFAAKERGANDADCQRLGEFYYRIREGLGFNKTPAEYGAFPADPYSHTPKHIGAQQPGMTGQVKEEMLARFGELGVLVSGGAVRFDTSLLRAREFAGKPHTLRYLDVDGQWQTIDLPGSSLAYTWCQVPIVYRLDDTAQPAITVLFDNGEQENLPTATLPAAQAREIFRRTGRIRQLELVVPRDRLFNA